MKKKTLLVLFILHLLPHFSNADSVRPIFILSLGGGTSTITDADIKSNEYVFNTLMDFKEKIELKNLWKISFQAYILQGFGIQLEYSHQKANYFSELKWYGWWYTGEITPIYVPINHFEDAYWSPWSLESYSIGFIIGGIRPLIGNLFPYATVGIGFFKIDGDPSRFLYRTRLSGIHQGLAIKIGAGVRHRILPFLGLNIKVSGETFRRSNPGLETKAYMGPEQLDIDLYYQTGQISRTRRALARTITLISAEIGLDIIFRFPQKKNQ